MLTQERAVLTEQERAQPLDVAPALGARPSAATGCHRLRPLGSIDAHPRGPIREGKAYLLDEVASERDDHIVDGIGGHPPLEVGVVRENKEVVPGVAECCERAAVEIEGLGFEHDALRGELPVCLANIIDAQHHPGVLADRRSSRLAAVIGVGRKRGDRPRRRDFDIAIACVTVAADEVFPLLHPEQVAEEMDGFVDVIDRHSHDVDTGDQGISNRGLLTRSAVVNPTR
jgi:hypothetical protein